MGLTQELRKENFCVLKEVGANLGKRDNAIYCHKDHYVFLLLIYHRETIVQLGYNSGHIAKPFSPLFYPHLSEYPSPFYLMCPRLIIKTC